MTKKKQNNIGDFDLNMDFDLCKDEYNLEAEIEPGYRFYVPWLHREFWEEQENEARTNQEEFALERRGNADKKQVDAVKVR